MNWEVERAPPKTNPRSASPRKNSMAKRRIGVAEEVGGEDLSLEAPCAVQPEEEEKQCEGGQRLVDLGRVQRHVDGHAHHAMGVLAGEGDGPGEGAGLSIVAPGGETAQAADGLAQGDGRRRGVGHGPEVHGRLPPDVEIAGGPWLPAGRRSRRRRPARTPG